MRTHWLSSLLFPLLIAPAAAGTNTGKIVIDGIEYGQGITQGDHRFATEQRRLPCFDHIRLEASIDLEYTPGKRCEVILEGDSNLLPLIETRVTGGGLQIRTRRSFQTDGVLRARVTSPDLRALTVQGSGDVYLHGIHSPELSVKVAGSDDIRGEGRVGRLDLTVDGSGDLDLGRLRAETVKIRLRGSADVIVHASQRLEVDLSGAGDVSYYGHPAQVITHISGAGDVEAMD
ncbi:hypothetical protein MIN45_P0481 [Methylomarinovum tepidoasis]|uniref:Putative auto-transporter adhesin head GIN domain-containing protein n=1 Tax=Methylomarinovum tepidoasis TaxID=2840183 RepID=A0AAU9C4N8_9GAMM|nr:head GIN domain-containing protein [Methylomarinovum sp. IN45]BCX88114.1 hypothetical protein MIN45_P0481 [Methylomarinovum sp. IN45]